VSVVVLMICGSGLEKCERWCLSLAGLVLLW